MKNDFNPIKEVTDGARARKVVWSTKTLELAIKGLEQGKKLVANPFYEYNTKLLKGDLVFERTKEEIKEWKKCAKDIHYFTEKYCKLMTPEGIKNIKLRDYQKKYLQHLVDNRLSIFLACRQCGKCLIFNQLIKIHKDITQIIDNRLKKYFDKFYYNDMEDCYELPLFELYNLFDNSFKWKIKYHLYKLLYKIESYERAKTKEGPTTRKLERGLS